MKRDYNVCLVTFLFDNAFIPPLSNLERVLSKICNLNVVEGCFKEINTPSIKNVNKHKILHKQSNNLLFRLIRLLHLQVRISLKMISLSNDTDFYIFFMGQWGFLPILTAKILRKRTLWLLPSSLQTIMEYNKNISIFMKFYLYFQKMSMSLSDRLILHSPNLITEWKLDKYENKIIFAHEYFIELEEFNIKTEFNKRKNLIGYVGRLSEEKGILNLIQSIELILKDIPSLEFVIIGDGDLKEEITNFIIKKGIEKNVKLIPWVERYKLPYYLNEMKLVVIPSYTESGPIIALESMACGTPVLLNKVGHISNLLTNGKNGYVMENNAPNSILKNVKNIMRSPHLDQVSYEAQKMVKREFTFKKTVQNWQKLLDEELL